MTPSKSTLYRRRKAILDRIEDLAYRVGRCNRRINPGHSSGYVPDPNSATHQAEMADGLEAYAEQTGLLTQLWALACRAKDAGASINRINAAAGRQLWWLEPTAWGWDNEPTNYRLCHDEALLKRIRWAAREQHPECKDMPRDVMGDYLADLGHAAAAACHYKGE